MHTDGVKLKQILLYLIDNAIKFTNTGGIRISWSQEANVTVFEVQDTGMGIDLEYREIIFDRFRQFSNQNGLNYGGTGLGLAIAKAYVQKLKGEIMLVSETGVGSTFYVRIPNLFTTQNLTMPEKKQTIKDCKVLIVEDDPNNYKYLRFILHRNGIHTLWAQTGAQGLHIMNEDDTVGLILMDIHLPDTNGYDLSKEIKLSHPNIPIVAQTAFAIGEEFENALSGLFFDYLSKPIDKESLLYMIKRINATYFV
jgi:CheY-like chemotaxis protein